jgi:hypothetical protein
VVIFGRRYQQIPYLLPNLAESFPACVQFFLQHLVFGRLLGFLHHLRNLCDALLMRLDLLVGRSDRRQLRQLYSKLLSVLGIKRRRLRE